jgi:peroxiredoxin Q/BCP
MLRDITLKGDNLTMNADSHKYFTKLLLSLEKETSLATIDNQDLLEKIKDKNLVIYFYPKDNTPGCISEGRDFVKLYQDFKSFNTEIIGISRDGVASHAKFKSRFKFPFELIADIDSVICESFKVIDHKTYMGIDRAKLVRSTFLFDMQGMLIKEWREVKVKGHVEEVLLAVKEISKSD